MSDIITAYHLLADVAMGPVSRSELQHCKLYTDALIEGLEASAYIIFSEDRIQATDKGIITVRALRELFDVTETALRREHNLPAPIYREHDPLAPDASS